MEKTTRPKKLFRSHNRILGGVLAGLSEYFYVDKTLVRLIYVLLSILMMGIPGILIYLVAWLVIPLKPREI